MINVDLVNRHIQAVAIQFVSYRGRLDSLAGFIAQSMGEQAPSRPALEHFLIQESTQKALLEYEVGIWKNHIGDWSLVSLATPPTIEAMQFRLNKFPTSNTQCRWCGQDGKRLAHLELVPELDIYGEPVFNSRCHKICMTPWLSMRRQVTRKGEHA